MEVLFTSDLEGPSVKVLGDKESKRQRQRGWAPLVGMSMREKSGVFMENNFKGTEDRQN